MKEFFIKESDNHILLLIFMMVEHFWKFHDLFKYRYLNYTFPISLFFFRIFTFFFYIFIFALTDLVFTNLKRHLSILC